MFRRQTANLEMGEYIAALSNRNATNLLATLGSAPPLSQEVIPETPQSSLAKQIIVEQLAKAGSWLGNMTGITSLIPGLRGAAQANINRFTNRLEYELEPFFYPMQTFIRDVIYSYEGLLDMYPTGSALGGILGGIFGYAVGSYYLGPAGGMITGYAGEILGSLAGAGLEAQADITGAAYFPMKGLDPLGTDFDIIIIDPNDPPPPSPPTIPNTPMMGPYKRGSADWMRNTIQQERIRNRDWYYIRGVDDAIYGGVIP